MNTPRTDEAWKQAEAACFRYDENVGMIGSYESVAGMMRDFARKLELELAAARAPRKSHDYWRAGEPDCPKDIKAPNGELHTLRCRVCGLDDPPKMSCSGPMTAAHRKSLGEDALSPCVP